VSVSSNKPFLVGITGGIGAGKSIVCRVFNVLGIPVYDADSRAKQLMVQDTLLISQIKALFGEKAYDDAGKLDNQYIASKVFKDKEKLSQLNGFVHPAVKKDFEKWVDENKNHPYLIKEAALLIEAESYKALDKLIVVTAPKDVKIKRVLNRDTHRDLEQVEAIMQKQLSDEEKIAIADYTLMNDGVEMLLPQILALHIQFSK